MLTYTFENRGNKSYYQYLYEQLKKDILSRRLSPGTKLPSKRSFAKNLNLSVMTVENAYAQLQVEGYIYSVEKKGYYVADIADQSPFHPDTPCNCLSGAVSSSKEYFADFTSNSIAKESFPFSTWARLMRQVLTRADNDLLNLSSPQGILPLREAIATHLYHFRGMKISPEQIIIGAGTEYLYGLLIQLLGRDKVYGLENPGYLKLSKIYDKNDVDFCYIDLDKSGISVDALVHSNVNIIHTSPSHHFPTGIIMPIKRRHELLNWAYGEEDRFIIEDDYDCEFRFLGLPIPALQSIDARERVIYLNTFSKSLTPSIRISYLVLPPSLVEKYRQTLGFYSCTVSNFEQYTLASFLSEGYFEKHINRMRNYYRNKRDNIIGFIKKSPLGKYASILEEDAGLHFLIRLNTGLSDREITARAEKAEIKLSCLSDYSYCENPSYLHTFVINYSGVSDERLEEAIDRLYRCLFPAS